MKTNYPDTNMMNHFAFLREHDLNAYATLKKTTGAIYRQSLAAIAEKEFLSKKDCFFESYSMLEEDAVVLAGFMDMQRPFHRLYVLRHTSESYAVVYTTDASRFIVEKKVLLEQHRIDDIFTAFLNCLIPRDMFYAEREHAVTPPFV